MRKIKLPTWDQIANIHWLKEKARELNKNIYFCFIDYAKAFGCVDHNKLWEILKEIRMPDHHNNFLRGLCAHQEAIVRTRHGTMDWFKIEKRVGQGCILSPCLFNLYAEYIMQNVGLDEAQAVIRLQGEITIISDADDTTLMAESKEELKSLLMKMNKDSEKAGLKLNIQKMNIMPSGPITWWQIKGEKLEIVTNYFLGSKVTAESDCSHEIKRCLLLGRKAMTGLDSILKSRDITLLTKVSLYSQSNGFSSSHVWMWEFHKKDWVLRNWCFWTVVWKKTHESPLDCKEIQPVHSKGNKSVLNIHWKDWC